MLEKGIVKGLWKYQIKLDDYCCKTIKDGLTTNEIQDSMAFDNCLIQFSQEYIHENKAGCPNNLCVKAINAKLLPR